MFLTNSGMLGVYHIQDKNIKSIGDLYIDTNQKYEQFCDMVVGITSDFSKFYLFEFAYKLPSDRWTNENGQTVTNIDGVWEIDISSLGLKDE